MTLPIGKKGHHSSAHRKAGRKAGYTLIELILVILLISILIGLSTPLFKRTFSDLQLKDTSFTIAKLINYAEEAAIVERTNYKLNFDFEEGRFWITKLNPSGDEPIYERISGKYGRYFSVPGGLVLTGDADEIIFYPDGRSDKLTIKIVNEIGEGRFLRTKGFGSTIEIEGVGDEE